MGGEGMRGLRWVMVILLFCLVAGSLISVSFHSIQSAFLTYRPDSPRIFAPGDIHVIEVQISAPEDDDVFFWNGTSWDQDGLGYTGLYTGYVHDEQ